MTLRLRLLLVLMGIVAVGLVTSDIATYSFLDSFLTSQVDQQLSQAVLPVGRDLLSESSIGGGGIGALHAGAGSFVPPGTYGILRDQSGTVLAESPFIYCTTNCGAAIPTAPALPVQLPGSGNSSTNGRFFNASSPGSQSIDYRVLAEPVEGGGTVVVAIPLTDAHDTLGRLLIIEVLVSVVVLGALGLLAWWMVRRGLRPLDEMATTAGAIAAGDLTQRVAHADADTEVGRLGSALNTMMGEIEGAFAARAASEEHLRRFLADASHELRTPLTSIRGYAEIFDRARDRPEDLATSMRHIRSEADRMSVLVDDLLLLARLDRERPFARDAVDLAAVVLASADAARVSAPLRSITTEVGGPVTVVGDASRLRQVVDNLVSNAITHTADGTPIEIRVTTADNQAVVEVQDHGPGVAADEQSKIFEPFHRSDPSRARSSGGVGLGLAIVSAIANAHAGDVGVVSNGSGGATFWVRLPVASTSAN